LDIFISVTRCSSNAKLASATFAPQIEIEVSLAENEFDRPAIFSQFLVVASEHSVGEVQMIVRQSVLRVLGEN
jgi:hypothetical protein